MNYTTVSQAKLDSTFAPFLKTKRANSKQAAIPAVHVEDYFDIKEKQQKKKGKAGKIALFTTGGIIGAGLLTLGIFSGTRSKAWKDLMETIAKQAHEVQNKKTTQDISDITIRIASKIEKGANKLEGLATINHAKDRFSDKVFRNKWFNDHFFNIGNKFANKMTIGFKNLTTNTTIKMINDARNSSNKLANMLETQAKHIRKTNAEDANKLSQYAKTLREEVGNYADGFNSVTTDGKPTRFEKMKTVIEGGVDEEGKQIEGISKFLDKTFGFDNLNAKEIFTDFKQTITNVGNVVKSNATKFAAEEHLAIHKGRLKYKLNNMRNSITYSDVDKINHAKRYIKQARVLQAGLENNKVLKVGDATSSLNSEFAKIKINEKNTAEELLSQLEGFNKVLDENIEAKAFSADEMKTIKQIKQKTQNSIHWLKKPEQGSLENCMDIINKHCDDDTKKVIQKSADTFRNDLDTAIKSESVELFDKYRDLEIGCAPPDVSGLITPVALTAYMVSKEDTKEEKVSTTLTKGIPAIGTVAAVLYAPIKQISGLNMMLFASITGIALNQAGSFIDKQIKKFQGKDQ